MDIKELREQIDRLDQVIVSAFGQRLSVSREIAAYKRMNHLPVFDPQREREVLSRRCAAVSEDRAAYVKLLFRVMMDAGKSYQRQCMAEGEFHGHISAALARAPRQVPSGAAVACAGFEPGEGQEAAERFLDAPYVLDCACPTEAFRALESGTCGYAVIAAVGGLNAELCEAVGRHGFCVIGIALCRAGGAAVRCVCIGHELQILPGANRISLALNAANGPGALYEVLTRFSALDLSLTWLDSRLVDGEAGKRRFYISLDASVLDRAVLDMLDGLEADAEAFSFLGAYTEEEG